MSRERVEKRLARERFHSWILKLNEHACHTQHLTWQYVNSCWCSSHRKEGKVRTTAEYWEEKLRERPARTILLSPWTLPNLNYTRLRSDKAHYAKADNGSRLLFKRFCSRKQLTDGGCFPLSSLNSSYTPLPPHVQSHLWTPGQKDRDEDLRWPRSPNFLNAIFLRGVNFGFWSRSGCSGQSANIWSRQGLA